jgi:hypothetical protein
VTIFKKLHNSSLRGGGAAPNRVIGPLNIICEKHKQELEKKNSKFCKQEKQKAKTRFKNFKIKYYLIKRYRLSSFFGTCNTNEDNMSTKSLIDTSFSDRLVINFYMLKP